MAERSRSEKLKNNLVFTLLFTFLYTLIVFILSFMILGWSWGEKQNVLMKLVVFIIKNPLKPESNLFFIPINGFVWSLLALLIYKTIKQLR